jgi:hypothetical protein
VATGDIDEREVDGTGKGKGEIGSSSSKENHEAAAKENIKQRKLGKVRHERPKETEKQREKSVVQDAEKFFSN